MNRRSDSTPRLTDEYLQIGFFLNEGQAEYVRDTIEGRVTAQPPDLPTQLRRIRLSRALQSLDSVRRHEVLGLANDFIQACPAYTDDDYAKADLIPI